jgi:hypothetical protein
MAYTIKTTNGSTIAIVQDATLNTVATSLTLVGRDYAGYGAFLNENFVYLLENFANGTAPTHQTTGQLWYDTANNLLKVYDSTNPGDGWKPISSSIAQSTSPTGASIGDLWFNTVLNQLNVFAGSPGPGWVTIGPTTTSTSGKISGAVVDSIEDSSSNKHIAIIFYIENNVVAVMSYDSSYAPKTTVAGFTLINPGLNLVNSSTLMGSQYTGDSSNALYLNGIGSGQFLRSDIDTTTAYKLIANGGLFVANVLSLINDTANAKVSISSTQQDSDLNLYVNQGGTNTAAIAIGASTGIVTINDAAVVTGALTASGTFTANGTTTLVDVTTVQSPIVPKNSGQTDLGSTAVRFGNVWATSLYGNVIGGVTSATTFTVAGATALNSTLTVSGTSTFTGNIVANGSISANGNIFISNVYVPAGNTAVGTKGQISWNNLHFYVCVSANLWARGDLTTTW